MVVMPTPCPGAQLSYHRRCPTKSHLLPSGGSSPSQTLLHLGTVRWEPTTLSQTRSSSSQTRNSLVFGARYLMSRLSYLHLFATKWRDCSGQAGIAGLLGKRSVGRKFSFQQPQHAALRSPLPSSLPRACSPGQRFPLCYVTSCRRKQDRATQPSPLHLSWGTYRLPAIQTHGFFVLAQKPPAAL